MNLKKPDITVKCRACSNSYKLNITDKKMAKVMIQFKCENKKHETDVQKKEDPKSAESSKIKAKIVAKISDQNYLIGSDELNKIVNHIRNK